MRGITKWQVFLCLWCLFSIVIFLGGPGSTVANWLEEKGTAFSRSNPLRPVVDEIGKALSGALGSVTMEPNEAWAIIEGVEIKNWWVALFVCAVFLFLAAFFFRFALRTRNFLDDILAGGVLIFVYTAVTMVGEKLDIGAVTSFRKPPVYLSLLGCLFIFLARRSQTRRMLWQTVLVSFLFFLVIATGGTLSLLGAALKKISSFGTWITGSSPASLLWAVVGGILLLAVILGPDKEKKEEKEEGEEE